MTLFEPFFFGVASCKKSSASDFSEKLHISDLVWVKKNLQGYKIVTTSDQVVPLDLVPKRARWSLKKWGASKNI